MKKNIIILRHAKSDIQNINSSDYERSINIRGKRDLPIMSSILILHYPKVDIALSSDSVRTTDTIQGIHKYGFKLPIVQYTPKLYLASAAKIEDELGGLSNDISTVLLCGHNPGVSEFIQKKCNIEFVDIPTLGVALLEMDVSDWSDIYATNCTLIRIDYPKKKEIED